MWEVRFKNEFYERPITLYAQKVDLDHPYLVCVSEICKKVHSSVLVVEDQTFEEFNDARKIFLPYHNVVFIKNMLEKEGSKVVQFKSVGEN